MKGSKVLGALCAVTLCVAQGPVRGMSAVERGHEIAEQAHLASAGWGDSSAQMSMVLRSAAGSTTQRQLKVLSLEGPGGAGRSMSIFLSPADVRGTILLNHARRQEADRQWMYLPALRRTRRIAAANRGASFMGSEFSLEDLMPPVLDKFDYRFLETRDCGESRCHLVERRPRYAHSGYSRQVVWYDLPALRVVHIDYFDHGERHIKALDFWDFHLYEDRHWRAHSMRVRNLLTGKSTDVVWRDIAFGTGRAERDFDKSLLGRLDY